MAQVARLQRLVTPIWRRIAGGCHPNRDTRSAIQQAGFAIDRVQDFPFRPSLVVAVATPHILGIARRQ